MEVYNGQLKDYEFDIEDLRSHHKTETGKSKHTYYNNTVLTFDIEVTSAWLDKSCKVIPYKKGKKNEYWNDLQPLALPYIWQFSVDGKVYYGRELTDFENVLKDLPQNAHSIIWVHNLSYEFAHLSGILEWESVFARTPHKPMKCVPKKYPYIEFRCSYMLTRLSLDTWGKQLGVEKATGDLKYDIIRTPLTKLSETELHYCEQDCIVVDAGIKTYLKQYGKLRKIPLTQTGTVRLEVKNLLMSNEQYCKFIKRLVPKTVEEYDMLQRIFAGGYTHANRLHAGNVIRGLIQHYDFASSYPTVMCCEKYPCSPWIYDSSRTLPDKSTFGKFAYIFHLKFTYVNCTTFNTYIQASKSKYKNAKLDNGRVISADYLEIWVTEQDYLTITETYEYKTIEVEEIYKSYKDYLPRDFIMYILDRYGEKTNYKDVEGYEDIYMRAKERANCLFGMCATAIVQADVILNGDEWTIDKLTPETVQEQLNRLSMSRKGEKKYFLSYSWGCYITSYARRNLWLCILGNGTPETNIDHDVLYCDTDSIFVIGKHNFEWYNKEVTDKLRKACKHLKIDFEKTRPKTPKGVPKPLGIFDRETDCSEFITLGAKRYCERRVKDKNDKNADGKLHITISGINKQSVSLLRNDIRNFKDGFEFDKDSEDVTKKLCTYLCNMPIVNYPDGYTSHYTHGINLRCIGYVLGMTDEYKELINYCDFNMADIQDEVYTAIRGYFDLNERGKSND